MSQTIYGALTIRAGDGARYLDQETGRYRRKYDIRVKSDGTGKEIRFAYHDSIANEQDGKVGLGPDDLLWAFRCFVEDASAGNLAFSEFADNFGYDQDSYSARLVHKACKRSATKFGNLYHDGREPETVLEDLTAKGIE